MEREAKFGIALSVGLALVLFVLILVVRALVGLGGPGVSSAEVVEGFREAGLEVGETYPVEDEPGHAESPAPKTYAEGTRFEIPSLGEDSGGRVFTYSSQGDLEVMRDYYTSLQDISPMFYSHVYVDGLVLVQINGELPKSQADRYGEVFRETV